MSNFFRTTLAILLLSALPTSQSHATSETDNEEKKSISIPAASNIPLVRSQTLESFIRPILSNPNTIVEEAFLYSKRAKQYLEYLDSAWNILEEAFQTTIETYGLVSSKLSEDEFNNLSTDQQTLVTQTLINFSAVYNQTCNVYLKNLDLLAPLRLIAADNVSIDTHEISDQEFLDSQFLLLQEVLADEVISPPPFISIEKNIFLKFAHNDNAFSITPASLPPLAEQVNFTTQIFEVIKNEILNELSKVFEQKTKLDVWVNFYDMVTGQYAPNQDSITPFVFLDQIESVREVINFQSTLYAVKMLMALKGVSKKQALEMLHLDVIMQVIKSNSIYSDEEIIKAAESMRSSDMVITGDSLVQHIQDIRNDDNNAVSEVLDNIINGVIKEMESTED